MRYSAVKQGDVYLVKVDGVVIGEASSLEEAIEKRDAAAMNGLESIEQALIDIAKLIEPREKVLNKKPKKAATK